MIKFKTILKIIIVLAACLFTIYMHIYGIDKLVLGSDELHPARTLISSDWSLVNYPWPKEAVREYYDNWPIQFPPLFGLLTRASVEMFGVNHFALRIFPALFSLLAVLGAFFLFRLYLSPNLAMITAIIMGLASDKLLIYAKSLKHYSADVLLSVLIIYWGKRLIDKSRLSSWIWFTLTASIAIWLGFASIYVAGTVFVVLFVQQLVYKKTPQREFWLSFITAGIVFFISFAGLYVISIANAVTNPVFIKEWLVQIFQWDKVTDLYYLYLYFGHMVKHILLIPAYLFFDSVWISIAGYALILVWIISQFKKRKFIDVLLLTMPLVLVLCASLAGKYPFSAGRLLLFLLPLWLLMMAMGLMVVYNYLAGRNRLSGVILLCLAGIVVSFGIYENFDKVNRMKYSGGRRVNDLMLTLKDKAIDGDTVYLHWGAILPFYFYFTDHQPGYSSEYPIKPGDGTIHVMWGEEHTQHPELNKPLFQRIQAVPGRLWIAFGHQWPTPDMLELEQQLDSTRVKEQEFKFKGCKLLLYAPVSENINEK